MADSIQIYVTSTLLIYHKFVFTSAIGTCGGAPAQVAAAGSESRTLNHAQWRVVMVTRSVFLVAKIGTTQFHVISFSNGSKCAMRTQGLLSGSLKIPRSVSIANPHFLFYLSLTFSYLYRIALGVELPLKRTVGAVTWYARICTAKLNFAGFASDLGERNGNVIPLN